jgi:adenylosuccinate synthase
MFYAVTGLQFGDEGKGKFVDYLSQIIGAVARFNGGANAGHSVKFEGRELSFSQLPAAPGARQLFVGPGALITPDVMIRELEFFEQMATPPRICIDPRAHVVLPIHVALNQASEAYKGEDRIGSVGKGIGACVEDRTNRTGIRLCDLLDRETLKSRLDRLWKIREGQIRHVFGGKMGKLEFDTVLGELCDFGSRIAPYLQFTNRQLTRCIDMGKPVLLETSQATFLDNIYGTYPYTVSYQTLVNSCFSLLGLPLSELHVVGVMKCYMIRVGNGPFPTELTGPIADRIRESGNEYGTVSGRPRRCGWLDLALVKHAVRLTGTREIALTNVDVLAGMPSISACLSYKRDGQTISVDEALLDLSRVEPHMAEFASWTMPISVTCYEDLPKTLQNFIEFIEDFVGVPVRYVSYGADRRQTLDRHLDDVTASLSRGSAHPELALKVRCCMNMTKPIKFKRLDKIASSPKLLILQWF